MSIFIIHRVVISIPGVKMTRIIVMFESTEARLPPSAISEEEAEAFKEAITDFVESNPSVTWSGFYANADGVGIAEWEAPNTEAIEAFYDDLEGVSPDAIVEVEKIPIL